MPTVNVTQNNFNSGELSSSLWAANDLQKYGNAVKVAQNALVGKTREIMNRGGLEFCAEAYKENGDIRLLPFKFNSEQAYIVEAGDKYFRFLKEGGLLSKDKVVQESRLYLQDVQSKNKYGAYTISSTTYVSDLFPEKIYTSGTVFYKDSAHTQRIDFPENVEFEFVPIKKLVREEGETFPKKRTVGYKLVFRVYETNVQIVLNTPYADKDLPKLKYAQTGDVMTLTNINNYQAYELIRQSDQNWKLDAVVTSASISAPTNLAGTWDGDSENPRKYQYKVTAIDGDYNESLPSAVCEVQAVYEASWEAGKKITLTWTAVSGATAYSVYRCVNGVYGFIGEATSTTFIDDRIEPDMTKTPPIKKNLYSENGYPGVVANYLQRRIFANFPDYPQRFVASQVANMYNFNISRPLIASDAITVDLCEIEINEIRHLIPLNNLVILTSGAEWAAKGVDGSFAASPAPICLPQSYHGSSDLMPIISGNMVLFVTATRDTIRDLGYSYLSESYDGDKLTEFVSHYFEDDKIKEWAFQKTADTVWCVTDKGCLLSLLYDKKQEICGWTHHNTDGKFLSVACVRENLTDVVYFVVEREICGVKKKYIERLKDRKFTKTSESFFVDCGLHKDFDEPVTTIGGLEHLEGKEVVALADGGAIDGLTVSDGTITLPYPAQSVTVGLPYTFRVELLPLDTAETAGKLKQVVGANIKIRNSREDFFVVSENSKRLQLPRSYESINDAEYLKTGSVSCEIFSDGKTETTFIVEQSLPLPLCISAITQKVAVSDD